MRLDVVAAIYAVKHQFPSIFDCYSVTADTIRTCNETLLLSISLPWNSQFCVVNQEVLTSTISDGSKSAADQPLHLKRAHL